MNAIAVGILTDGDLTKCLNESISKIQGENNALRRCKEVFDVEIPKELEILDDQYLGRRKGKECCVIWLWCKSQKSLCKLCKLTESDQLFKRLDILMEDTEYRSKVLESLSKTTFVLKFLKTRRLDTMQFQRKVGKHDKTTIVVFSKQLNLPTVLIML